jgi:O-antigen/teichoic acid export membrane protein
LALDAVKQSQRVVKNLSASTVGNVLSSLMQLGAVVIVARALPVEQFAVYSMTVAFASVLQRSGDMGIGSILVRDLAVKPENTGKLLGAALTLAWLFVIAVAAIMAVVIPFLHLSGEVKLATALMGLSGLMGFQAGYYGAVIRSQEDNEFHALGYVIYGLAVFILVLLAAHSWSVLVSVSLACLLANIIQMLFFRWVVVQRYERLQIGVNFALWKYLLANAVPVGLSTLGRTVGDQSDIFVLSWLTNLRDTGLYSGAFKVVTALRFVTQPVMFVLFPLYSRAAIGSKGKAEFRDIYERVLKALILIAFPLAVIFFATPRALVVGFFGSRYVDAAPVMRLMSMAVWIFFVESAFPMLLTSLHQQGILLSSTGAALVLRVVLNLVLTWRLGIIGPCWAIALSETALLVYWIVRLWNQGYRLPVVDLFWRPCIASLLMGAILYYSHAHSIPLRAMVVLLSGALYCVVTVKLGAVSKDERELAREGLNFLRPFLAELSFQKKQ